MSAVTADRRAQERARTILRKQQRLAKYADMMTPRRPKGR